MAGLESDAVQRALWNDRSLVKTWAMRGTLHLLPAADYPLWETGLSTYRHYLKPAWSRAFGLTPEGVDELVAAVGDALDGRMLTREELAYEVSEATGSAELGEKLGQSWGALLKPVSFRGRLCYAPSRGQKVRFTRPDQWLARGSLSSSTWSPAEPDGAMREIARRFLAAHTRGLRPLVRDCPRSRREADPVPRRRGHRGRHRGHPSLDARRAGLGGTGVRPIGAGTRAPPAAFDQYVIAATRHAANLLPGPFKERVYRAQGWLSPVILVEGRMDGVWRHERSGDRLVVEVEPFADLSPAARHGVEEEAERLAGFLGGSLEPGLALVHRLDIILGCQRHQ